MFLAFDPEKSPTAPKKDAKLDQKAKKALKEKVEQQLDRETRPEDQQKI
jgi:hypothetical protein